MLASGPTFRRGILFAAVLLTALLPTTLLGDVPAIHLVAPRAEAVLEGGSTAMVEWVADAPLPSAVEEWEAFLSVDGGRYYAARITPHLDAGVRRFAFAVPNVASGDARILLRFGDEKREMEVELPARFSIRATSAPPSTAQVLTNDDGERGTAVWVAGARDGSGLRTVAKRTSSWSSASIIAICLPLLEDAESPDAVVLRLADEGFAVLARPRRRLVSRILRPSHDRLLDTMRLNI